jgi:predicted TIM-barrel fold metal-dependent hydrolase
MDASGIEGGAAVQHRGTYGYDNSYILDSSEARKDRFVPVVVLDAQDAKTPALVRELVKSRGLAGVRLTGTRADAGGFPWMDSTAAAATWVVANEFGLVVNLMSVPPGKSPEAIADYIRLAQKYPNARLVLDHVAWPNAESGPDYGIDATHRELAKQRNIYYKFTTINLDLLREGKVSEPDMLKRVVDVYDADHVMWGSDIGNSAGAYPEMVARIVAAASKLTVAEKRKVLHDTGKAVFVRGGVSAVRKAA